MRHPIFLRPGSSGRSALALELIILTFLGLGTVGCGGPTPGKIEYVVIIFQENRTPDNLFHGLPNADIANNGLNSKGEAISLSPMSLQTTYDLDHSHRAFLEMYDGGKMDGADKVALECGVPSCPENPQFKYVEPSDVAPYFQLAEQYTFGDRMFQTNQGPSFPAHQYIISGTSAPNTHSEFFAAENVAGPVLPGPNSFLRSGCAGPTAQTVALIGPAGYERKQQFACFDHSTLMDLLDPRQIDWRYYTTALNWESAIWTAPNAIRHLRFGPDWTKVVPSSAQVLKDVENETLPQSVGSYPQGKHLITQL